MLLIGNSSIFMGYCLLPQQTANLPQGQVKIRRVDPKHWRSLLFWNSFSWETRRTSQELTFLKGTLWEFNSLLLNMAIEIVDYPLKMVIFNSKLLVYQRVSGFFGCWEQRIQWFNSIPHFWTDPCLVSRVLKIALQQEWAQVMLAPSLSLASLFPFSNYCIICWGNSRYLWHILIIIIRFTKLIYIYIIYPYYIPMISL